MAKRIEITQIKNFSEEQLNRLLGKTVMETDKRLKMQSPVKTGRFRMSWAVWQDTPGNYDADPDGEWPALTEGKYASAPNSPEGGPPKKMNYGKEKMNSHYYISNSLPYAEPIAEGHSGQAPAGWIQTITAEMKAYVNRGGKR